MTKDMKSPVSGKLPTLLGVAAINKAIDDVCKAAATIQEQLQQAGLQCLMHLEKHGDVGPINRLFLAMPKGLRRNALAEWAMAHGALEVNTTPDTRKTMPMRFSKGKTTDPEAAMADPWYLHAPEKSIDTVFDLQKAIHGILARAKGKTVTLHGRVMRAGEAEMALNTLAALAGEEYKPEVHQDTKDVIEARGTETDGGDPPAADVPAKAEKAKEPARVKGGVKGSATRAAPALV